MSAGLIYEIQQTCTADGVCSRMEDVQETSFMPKDHSVSAILEKYQHYAENVDVKHFKGESLGYVTPWNGHGYICAEKFRSKFTYISPVWYQLRSNDQQIPGLTGRHDVDEDWIHRLREEGDEEDPFIVPRVIFEMNTLTLNQQRVITELILNEITKRDYDGIVFEIPVVPQTTDFIKKLGQQLQELDKLLILVFPPHDILANPKAKKTLLLSLSASVHRFSINMYDYSRRQPGPNAPDSWVRKNLQTLLNPSDVEATLAPKLLIGIPFYGYDNGEAIVANQFIDLLKKYTPEKLKWDESAKESYFEYQQKGVKHTVYFPSLQFLKHRLKLLNEFNVGYVIWELGQGMDYFYDLL